MTKLMELKKLVREVELERRQLLFKVAQPLAAMVQLEASEEGVKTGLYALGLAIPDAMVDASHAALKIEEGLSNALARTLILWSTKGLEAAIDHLHHELWGARGMKMDIEALASKVPGPFNRPTGVGEIKPAIFALNEMHTTHVTKTQARKERAAARKVKR